MPHIPRIPSTIGVPLELRQPPQERHAAIPITVEQTNKEQLTATNKGMPSVNKISLKDWKVSPKNIFHSLFGREPVIDPHTGQMVYPTK